MSLLLEIFDLDGAARAIAPDPTKSKIYQDGYAAGKLAAEMELAQDQSSLKSKLVHEIADMSFGFNEAQAHILTQITPLISSILDVMLPAVQTTSLKSQLLEMISAALEIDVTAPAYLTVHPDQEDAIAMALADIQHPHLILKSNNKLTKHAAITTLCNGETSLDLDAVLHLITGVLHNLPGTLKGNI